MTGNSNMRLEGQSKDNEQEPFRFNQTENVYRNLSLFPDTVMFEFSYSDRQLYLSPNTEKQIDVMWFERLFSKCRDNAPKAGEIYSFEVCMGKAGEPYHWCSCKLVATWESHMSVPVKLIGKLQDITGLKAREEQLILQSSKDGLTGVYNKKAFEYRVEEQLKENEQGWFCMIDIDNFKEINDCYGHPTGDRMLVEIGNLLCNIFPEPDLIGRAGGDEFAVFTTARDVYERAEQILEKVEKIAENDEAGLSVSIGIVTASGLCGEGYRDLFTKADCAMYEAKNGGKNRIAFFNL